MPTAVLSTVTLNGQQVGEAVHLICKLFDLNELKQMVRTKLDLDLAVVVALPAPLETVAYDLVNHLLRRGGIGEFLDATVKDRPRDEALRLFVGRVKGNVSATGAEEQAAAFRSAIGAVTEVVKTDPVASGMVSGAKAWFKVTRDELDRLARYKALHDCLHTVQFQITAITRAARAFPTDPSAGRELVLYCDQLDRLAKRARVQATGLEKPEDELVWVDEFDQARTAARGAVKATTQLTDPIIALARLLPETARINGEMSNAVRRLRPGLEELTETIGTLTRQLVSARRSDGVVLRLQKGTEALCELIPQLAGLTSAHDTWQKVETALAAAETAPVAPPATRVPRWGQIKKLLPRVCPPGSVADPTADPLILAEQWESATDPTGRENAFIALIAAARHEFKDVDDRLLELADQLTDTTVPLDTLLQVI